MRRGVSQLDLDMFYKLFMMADRDILTNLDSSVLHFDDIKAYKDALSTIDIREMYALHVPDMNVKNHL